MAAGRVKAGVFDDGIAVFGFSVTIPLVEIRRHSLAFISFINAKDYGTLGKVTFSYHFSLKPRYPPMPGEVNP